MAAQESFPWTTTEHCERYCQLVKAQQKLLRTAWDDLELGVDNQTELLKATATRAEEIWHDALRHAEHQRANVLEQIEDAKARTDRTRGELSDETFAETEARRPKVPASRLYCAMRQLTS